MTLLNELTPEQARAFAPDAASAKAAERLAVPNKWLFLQQAEAIIWAEFQGSGRTPYQTAVTLDDVAFRCSCPSRKLPCKHGLALLFTFLGQANAFAVAAPPDWVTDWQAARAARKEKAVVPDKQTAVADPEAQAKRVAKREQKLDKGLELFQLWLYDLIRQGLMAAKKQPPRYWEEMAARLIDAQAPGLARLVQKTASLCYAGSQWHQLLLQQLALLHLLVQAYGRLPHLSPEQQADVRTAVGWQIKQEELLAEAGLHDRWLVLGRRVQENNGLQTQFTWLWGQKNQQPALLLDFFQRHAAPPLSRLPGQQYQSELVFYPSAAPLRALVKDEAPTPTAVTDLAQVADNLTFSTAVGLFNQMQAQNPWLERVAFPLTNVVPIIDETGAFIQDSQQYRMPLRMPDWKLQAISGGHPIHLTAEWDGAAWLPLAAWADGRCVSL